MRPVLIIVRSDVVVIAFHAIGAQSESILKDGKARENDEFDGGPVDGSGIRGVSLIDFSTLCTSG